MEGVVIIESRMFDEEVQRKMGRKGILLLIN